jgi:hypothetical protein
MSSWRGAQARRFVSFVFVLWHGICAELLRTVPRSTCSGFQCIGPWKVHQSDGLSCRDPRLSWPNEWDVSPVRLSLDNMSVFRVCLEDSAVNIMTCHNLSNPAVDSHMTGGTLPVLQRNKLVNCNKNFGCFTLSGLKAQSYVLLFVIPFWDFRIPYLISWHSVCASFMDFLSQWETFRVTRGTEVPSTFHTKEWAFF